MKFKIVPFIITVVSTLLLQVILSILSSAVSDVRAPMAQTPDITNGLASNGICLCGGLIYLLAGAAYGMLGARQQPFRARDGALGGAAANAIAWVGNFIFQVCLIVLVYPRLQGTYLQQAPLPTENWMFLVVLAVYAFSGVTSIVLGALGGGVAARLAGPQKAAPPA